MDPNLFSEQVRAFFEVSQHFGNELRELGISQVGITEDILTIELYLCPSTHQSDDTNRGNLEGGNYDLEEDAALNLDIHTILSSSTRSAQYRGKLEIHYDEAFQIPAPYLRVWKQEDGSLADWKTLQTIIPKVDDPTSTVEDHTVYHFGTWTVGIHPINGQQFWTLHVCDMRRLFDLIFADENTDHGHTCKAENSFLWWMSVVLPTLGISFPPQLFAAFSQEMKS